MISVAGNMQYIDNTKWETGHFWEAAKEGPCCTHLTSLPNAACAISKWQVWLLIHVTGFLQKLKHSNNVQYTTDQKCVIGSAPCLFDNHHGELAKRTMQHSSNASQVFLWHTVAQGQYYGSCACVCGCCVCVRMCVCGWSSNKVSLLMINVFICSGISYLGVISRNHLELNSIWN